MSETKKALGRKSRTIGKENRSRVYLLLTKKPLTFTELLEESGLSRASLSNHLKNLTRDKRVTKVLENNQVVYKANLETDKVIEELKSGFADSLVNLISVISPNFRKRFDVFLEELAKDIIEYGEKEALQRLKERSNATEIQEIKAVKRSEEES